MVIPRLYEANKLKKSLTKKDWVEAVKRHAAISLRHKQKVYLIYRDNPSCAPNDWLVDFTRLEATMFKYDGKNWSKETMLHIIDIRKSDWRDYLYYKIYENC